MSDALKDRMRHPRREQTKIHVDHLNVGKLHVRESQVHDSLKFHFDRDISEANLGRAEVATLIAWLQAWSATEVAVRS